MAEEANTVSEITRRDIIDRIGVDQVVWWGRLEETNFVRRVFPNLDELPSYDARFKTAAGDIAQHREFNNDWEPDWIFHDPRFQLFTGTDSLFLRFLCETAHPIVRPDKKEAAELVAMYNEHLRHDGWELVEVKKISGKSVYGPRQLGISTASIVAKDLAERVDPNYIGQQVRRMESALHTGDDELVVGTAKELVESVCKTILEERGVSVEPGSELPKLVHHCLDVLEMLPGKIAVKSKGEAAMRELLGALQKVVSSSAQLRNLYGSGHGKAGGTIGLEARHARLMMGASASLSLFLYESHKAFDETFDQFYGELYAEDGSN